MAFNDDQSINQVILYDASGNPMAVQDGVAIPANTRALLVVGKDSSGNARYLATDASGNLVTNISGGASFGATFPSTGIAAGFLDATPNMQGARVFDLDSGVGVENVLGVSLRTSNAGGSIEAKGQQTMANSLPVSIASNQTAIPVTNIPPGSLASLRTGKVTLGGGTSGTLNAIRWTTYTEQTVNAQRSLKSSSTSDTNSGGVGARQVKITYYDALGSGPFIDTVNLNGTTVVPTNATNICFVEHMEVTSVGSTGRNVGTIHLFVNNAGGGGTIGTIGTGGMVAGQGDNKTLWAHHYVADTKSAKLATLVASVISGGSGTATTFHLRAKDPRNATDPEILISDLLLVAEDAIVRTMTIPIVVDGFKRITVYAVPHVNNVTMTATFDFLES
jgi:hypothetical protein